MIDLTELVQAPELDDGGRLQVTDILLKTLHITLDRFGDSAIIVLASLPYRFLLFTSDCRCLLVRIMLTTDLVAMPFREWVSRPPALL